MRPALPHLRQLCPEVPPDLVAEHLKRLGDDYFEYFNLDRVCAHLRGLAGLSPDDPVEVQLEGERDGYFECTILSFDYPSVFSLITDMLCGVGANVLSGEVFTYARELEPLALPGRSWHGGGKPVRPRYGRRRIIDQLWCAIDSETSAEQWASHVKAELGKILRLLEKRDDRAVVEAKQRVNEIVIRRLVELQLPESPIVQPVDIEIDNDSGPWTSLKVVAHDTPAFLYSLSSAIALQGCSIEHVRIRTTRGRVRDEFDFVDSRGAPLLDKEAQDRVRMCVLLTRQFTFFLDKAPDPFTALSRFDQLVEQFLRIPDSETWVEQLRNPRLMEELARLLGASDYLWEDFIRMRYESLLPVLVRNLEGAAMAETESIQVRIEEALQGVEDFEKRCERLNQFKDEQIFLIDLDHILKPQVDFREMAESLTQVAETVIATAVRIIYEDLVERHGTPRTEGGAEARLGVFGLGKLGGQALGYASDLELLVVYDENGETDGDPPLGNAEFFTRLVTLIPKAIRAKREGIFEVDLRLRPYGKHGPLACSLDSFRTYYAPDGEAHAVEKLALVRLRAIGGDARLQGEVVRLRDEFIYGSDGLDVNAVWKMRLKQYEERGRVDRFNAKYSLGGLVDIEYSVQLLQVLHGGRYPALRTPSIHRALEGLRDAALVEADESRRLTEAYDFLRRLINGLRMLRGSARDLQLPPVDSDEYTHLARRTGYERQGTLEPSQRLRVELAKHSAVVRAFVERHLDQDLTDRLLQGSLADLVLADEPTADLSRKVLEPLGFREPGSALDVLRRMAGGGERLDLFLGLVVWFEEIVVGEPDADTALRNWERLIEAIRDPLEHYRSLLATPDRLRLLLSVLGRSRLLADTLILYPELTDRVTSSESLGRAPKRRELERELRVLSRSGTDVRAWEDSLREFQRRELFRIGTRDVCLRTPTEEVLRDLTRVAEATVQVTLEKVHQSLRVSGRGPDDILERFCILGLGELAAGEIGYDAELELLGLVGGGDASSELVEAGSGLLDGVLAELRVERGSWQLYRVRVGALEFREGGDSRTASASDLETYFGERAKPVELLPLLALRPIAGGQQVGRELLEALAPVLCRRYDRAAVTQAVRSLRGARVPKIVEPGSFSFDVENGGGGLRDLELLTRALQLLHAADSPGVLSPSTTEAIEAFGSEGVLSRNRAGALKQYHRLLRRARGCLQLLFELPADLRLTEERLPLLDARIPECASSDTDLRDAVRRGSDLVRDLFREHFPGAWS